MDRRISFTPWILAVLVGSSSMLLGCSSLLSINEADFSGEIFVKPGDRVQLNIGFSWLMFTVPTTLPAHWSLDSTEFGTIHPGSGLLEVNSDAPDGATFSVYADGEIATVYVFEQPELSENPLPGYWRELKQVSCQTSNETEPENPIEAVLFYPNRKFTVTWRPFESYRDYWGSYTFDAATGALEMRVHGGNHVPDDFDGVGTAVIQNDGALLLSDMWLGARIFTEGQEPATPECGHRLIKTRAFTENALYAPIQWLKG